MKTNVLLFLSAAILLGFTSCNQKSVNTGELFRIDFSKNYPTKEILLQDIADIEYIPLETRDDVLLGSYSHISYVSDKYIFLVDGIRGDMYLFQRNGKIISYFNHMGRGPGEYIVILSAIFDEKNEEIFVFDYYQTLVYSLTGAYKRTLKSVGIIFSPAYNFDDDTILVYDENGFETDDLLEKPYLLLSKQDGTIVSCLDITLPIRYSTMKMTANGGNNGIFFSKNLRDGPDFMIADISSDTIFKVSNKKELVPLVVRHPSVHTSEPRTVWALGLITDKFITVSFPILDFDFKKNHSGHEDRKPALRLMLEFESGKTSKFQFVNNDFSSKELRWAVGGIDVPKNMAVNLYDAVSLKDAYNEKMLKGELEQLAATLNEDDNPVVMMVKFK